MITAKNISSGFTLIELLIVIAIIGILSGIIVTQVGGTRSKARDARRLEDMRQISPAMESVMNDDANFFRSPTVVGTLPAIVNSNGKVYLVSIYDPLGDAEHQYIWVGNDGTQFCNGNAPGQYYCVLTKLESAAPCPSGQYHYFVVNNKGQKDHCDAHNYNSAASAPDICTCASW